MFYIKKSVFSLLTKIICYFYIISTINKGTASPVILKTKENLCMWPSLLYFYTTTKKENYVCCKALINYHNNC